MTWREAARETPRALWSCTIEPFFHFYPIAISLIFLLALMATLNLAADLIESMFP